MKKTLIASAIAAATLSSAAFAAGPTIYGNIQLAYGHQSYDEGNGATEETLNDFFDNGSTIGVKADHEIAPGITGFMKAEFEFSADADNININEERGGGINKLDEAYMGVKGGFGSVLVGSEDTVYEWTDMIDFTESSSYGDSLFDNKFQGEIAKDEEGDQLQYVSPTIGGGLTVGVSVPLTNETRYSGQIAGMYTANMFDVALAYSMGKDQSGTEYGDSIGFAAKVKLNQLAVIGQYETRSADAVAGVDIDSTERDLWALAGVYGLGKTQLALGYKMEENGASVAEEKDLVFLQALHNLSDNMYAYVEFGVGSVDEGTDSADTEKLVIGAAYNF
ncbi:MAG: porin [Hahellaceae bacterium]|jgi:predicted porin|nr:porin [Hahellaceae bacterium]